jgi:hypothetical protein
MFDPFSATEAAGSAQLDKLGTPFHLDRLSELSRAPDDVERDPNFPGWLSETVF